MARICGSSGIVFLGSWPSRRHMDGGHFDAVLDGANAAVPNTELSQSDLQLLRRRDLRPRNETTRRGAGCTSGRNQGVYQKLWRADTYPSSPFGQAGKCGFPAMAELCPVHLRKSEDGRLTSCATPLRRVSDRKRGKSMFAEQLRRAVEARAARRVACAGGASAAAVPKARAPIEAPKCAARSRRRCRPVPIACRTTCATG